MKSSKILTYFLLQIWDVLTNDEVIMVVSSVRNRSMAAKVLVARAVWAWKTKYPGCKVDDCAVVCLFFKDAEDLDQTELNAPKSQPEKRAPRLPRPVKGKADASSATGKSDKNSNLEWDALEGVTRVNSLLKLPRLSSLLHRKKAPKSQADTDEARSISVLQWFAGSVKTRVLRHYENNQVHRNWNTIKLNVRRDWKRASEGPTKTANPARSAQGYNLFNQCVSPRVSNYIQHILGFE